MVELKCLAGGAIPLRFPITGNRSNVVRHTRVLLFRGGGPQHSPQRAKRTVLRDPRMNPLTRLGVLARELSHQKAAMTLGQGQCLERMRLR